MQRTFAMLVLLAGVTTSGQAQRSWQTEFGIQGGFTRLVAAGTGGDPTDAFSLPGFSLGSLAPSAAGLYVIVPWSQKLAVEADVAASQFTTGATATLLSVDIRGDYALTRSIYAAAGGALTYNNGLGANETQLGIQGALGYRYRLSRALNARLEARATFFGKAENVGPVDTYSVLLGVSTVTSRGRAGRSTSTASTRRAWTPQLGIAGGYANVHLVGGGSLSALAVPGYGGALGPALGSGPGFSEVTLPPTVFAIIPVGDKIAVEPALDIHRFQASGQTDFSGNLSVRLDYAVHGGWYGAVGGNLHYIKTTGVDAATRTGINLGWGYRFPLVSALGGRVELNYTMFGENTDLGLAPTNTFGLMFGATMPLR